MRYAAEDGDLRGSAAAACQQPANDLWLVGANTALGRTAVLNLTNASGSPATVSLDLFGAKGQIQAPGSRGLLVAPGTTRSVILAGLAPGQERLSVRVRSAGGPVAAVIQQSVLRGLTPGRRRIHRPGHGTGPPPGDLRRRHPGPGRAGGPHGEARLRGRRTGPADHRARVRRRRRCDQAVRAGRPKGPARRRSGHGQRPEPSPRSRSPECRPGPTPWPSVRTFPSPRRPASPGASTPRTPPTSPGPRPRRGSEASTWWPCPASGDRYLVFGAPEGRATISYTPITADGKIRAAAAADIAGGTTASIKVPADVGGSPLVGYLVSAAGDPAYGAVLLQQEGRPDISTVAIAPGAAGQEQVPVTLGY